MPACDGITPGVKSGSAGFGTVLPPCVRRPKSESGTNYHSPPQMPFFFARSLRILVLIFMTRAAVPVSAGDKPAKTLPVPGESFHLDGHEAFLILPPGKLKGPTPWVWYAPTLPGLPGSEEKWMFDKFTAAGIAIAGIDADECYGSPAGRAIYSTLYRELTEKRGLARKPVMLGRSRGGLMTLSWAADNPDKVGGFAGIYPVCDLTSYPGIAKACSAYGLTAAELEAKLRDHNPIERMAPLTKAGVPFFAIHGDVDQLVPLEANSAELRRRYEKLGGTMDLVIPKNQGHNMWTGFFQCEELVAFVLKNARP